MNTTTEWQKLIRTDGWACVWVALALLAQPAHALDWRSLWDFANPAVSQQRFEAALAAPATTRDQAFVLQTQIARTHGLRGDFTAQRALLRSLEPMLATTSAEGQVLHALEWGRSFASAKHDAAKLSEADKVQARQSWTQALNLAKAHQLDALAIDAIHMFAFTDTAPADQLKRADEALAVSVASTQPAARAWEASIRNNRGYALNQLGRYEEAHEEFTAQVALRQAAGDAKRLHVARYMLAWNLRLMGKTAEALIIQTQLAAELAARGERDGFVESELELLKASKP